MEKTQVNQQQDAYKNELKTEVAIVGYGPVGAALAVYLGKLGVLTVVIEKNLDIVHMPRAIALDNEALRVLQQIGLSDDCFEKIIIDKVQMYCPFLGKFAEMNTSGQIDMHPKLVTFYQPDLEKALRKQLEAYEHVRVLLGTEFLSFDEQADSICISVRNTEEEKQNIRAQYLIAADGASSQIRSSIGLDFCGESYSEDWLIVDAKNRQGKAIDHVEFICDPKRPTPHMPAPGGRERWEFMLKANETREEMEKPEKIKELLKPWINTHDIEIERQAVYRFHARCCDKFQKGRVFLVGDAAHITPPFVGQGLVAGLRDIANLGWKLKIALRLNNAVAILETYDLERRPHAKKMIQLAKGMGLMVMPQNKIKAITTHGLIKSLGLFPLTKQYFTELKVKPQIKYKEGFFQRKKRYSSFKKHDFEIGKQASQILLRDRLGQVIKSDHCWQDTFVLVGLGIDPRRLISEEIQHQWIAIGGKICTISTLFEATSLRGLVDVQQQWAKKMTQPFIAIIRPDGIIYDVFESKNSSESVLDCIRHLT